MDLIQAQDKGLEEEKMKANNGSGNNESRDEWETPKWLFKELDKQYGFGVDCCATLQNKKTEVHCRDFLIIKEIKENTAWMNPPFSKAYQMFEHFFKVVHKGVAIYRCDNMETKLWQEKIFPNATWIFIPNKRICYEGMEGKGSRFPSALIGLNVEIPKGLKGIILVVNK